MEFRAGIAATGHFGVELDIRSLDANDRLTAESWLKFYKSRRGLIHGGDLWLGEAGDGVVWQAHGKPDDLLLFVFRLEPTAERHAPAICLPMLDTARHYRVRIDQGWQRRGWMTGGAFFVELATEGVEFSGDWLRSAGLPMPPMLAESAVVFRLSAL
jgi:alpha-galactosidase